MAISLGIYPIFRQTQKQVPAAVLMSNRLTWSLTLSVAVASIFYIDFLHPLFGVSCQGHCSPQSTWWQQDQHHAQWPTECAAAQQWTSTLVHWFTVIHEKL